MLTSLPFSLVFQRRDLNARIEALMRAEQDGAESEEEVEEISGAAGASAQLEGANSPADNKVD